MRRMRRALVTLLATAVGVGLVAPSAAGTVRDAPTPPGAVGSEEFAAGLAVAQTGKQTSPYVQASSPEQATRILDALQSPQTASPVD